MLQQSNEMPTVWGCVIERLFSRRQLIGLAVAVTFAGLAALSAAVPAYAEDLAPNASPLGEVVLQSAPKNVYMESNTRLWYTLPAVGKLALVDGGAVSYFDVGSGSQPYDLVVQDGAVWFTMLAVNKIGKLNIASHVLTTYDIPTANSHPTGITFGGGYVWFVERTGDKLGQLDRASGTIKEYYDWLYDFDTDNNLVDMKGAQLEDVAYIAGNVWFTGPTLRLGGADLYKPGTGKWVASPNNQSGAAPMQIAGDSLGNVWVTFSGLNYIGRSALNTLAVWDPFRLPAGTGGPVGLFIREANNVRELWYTRPERNSVGRVATRYSGVTINTEETPLPTANSAPWGIAVTGDGSAWTATSNAAKTVTWSAPYYSFFLRLPLLLCNSGTCVQ
jgi:streptogramin lyase